jgi:hypothetical protein
VRHSQGIGDGIGDFFLSEAAREIGALAFGLPFFREMDTARKASVAGSEMAVFSIATITQASRTGKLASP